MDITAAAAANNAAWCDVVCRSHGIRTAVSSGMWVALGRPPAWYPDAVSLHAHVQTADVLALAGDQPSFTIKDSFGDLDLAPHGYELLFAAEWIHREPPVDVTLPFGWTIVETAAELSRWSAAHGGVGTFREQLLADPTVRVLVQRRDDQVVAGAVANHSAEVVGISNVFCARTDAGAAWREISSLAARCFPGLPLVGYERASAIDAAISGGFVPVGPLCVWRRAHRPPNGTAISTGAATTVVLVEGASDQLAIETLAERRGRNLLAEHISILAMGGATNIGRFLETYGPHGMNIRLAGLCDEAEVGVFRRGLLRAGFGPNLTQVEMEALHFYICRSDLEDELIRALGVPAVKDILDARGDLPSFRLFQQMPAQRAKPEQAQLRRFMGTRGGRKIEYAPVLVTALDLARVPAPLDRLLTHLEATTPGDR